jgi:SNF2 family DNA or RNA helicase
MLTKAAARPDRIGQTKPISVYYLLAKGTIDEILLETLRRKQAILTDTLDGGVSRKEDFDIYDQVSQRLKETKR